MALGQDIMVNRTWADGTERLFNAAPEDPANRVSGWVNPQMAPLQGGLNDPFSSSKRSEDHPVSKNR